MRSPDRTGPLYQLGYWTAFELPPHRDSLSMFKPILPLYSISFKVDGNDVHHGSLWGPVIMEVAFSVLKPSRRVSIEGRPPSCVYMLDPARVLLSLEGSL
ncbi:hypothetical protein BHE74_00009326 [Ensete ventricosum]|nr:hypothetical protein BHE74_00009326 [Ensete ventricosum]